MALIKCEECGQMVSDRASACPHCGCPIVKPMVCPECGQTIAIGDSYCLKCGCPLNQADNNGVQTSINPNQDLGQADIKEKSNNPLQWLLIVLATFIVLSGVSLFAWQRGLFNNTLAQNDTTAVDSIALDTLPDMAAPVIELNEDGMYTVENCPTTYKGLEILIEKNFDGAITKIDVIKDGNLNCSFSASGDEFAKIDSEHIHFLDANFDGYVDFFVGPVYDRSFSMLFLWDPSVSKFQIATDSGQTIFNGIYHFHPAEEKVYSINTGGWASTCIACNYWIGNRLCCDEILYEEFLHSNYSEDRPNRYVIKEDAYNGKIILSTDNPQKIPARWKKWASVPTPEKEKQYAEADARAYAANESYSPHDDEMEYEDAINEHETASVKSWIQGNWRYRMVSELGAMECRVSINGDYIVVMYNGEVQYSGPYTIEGDNIIYKRGKGWSEGIMIDREHKRLMATESEPMRRM